MTWLIAAALCLFAEQSVAQQVYANSQTNGVTGLCLGCGVASANNAVNNSSLTDYSQFNILAGLGSVTVYQTLIFPSLSSSDCDSLIIGIGAITSPATNPYGPVKVQTYNGNTANNDAQMVHDSMLRQVQGYGKAEIVLKPQQPFDRVRVTLNSNGLGLLTSFRIYYAYRKPGLAAPDVTDSTSICTGATATLTATAAGGATIHWYDAVTGGNLLATGNSYAVTPAVTTTYYAATVSGACISARRPVTVIVNKLPSPDLTVPQGSVCGSQLLPVNNHQQGFNYHVRVRYTNASSIVVLDTSYVVINSNTIATPANNSASDVQATIDVQAQNPAAGCRSDTVQGSFTVGGAGMLPTVDAPSVTTCQGSPVTLHAYTQDPSIPFIVWYDAPSGGNLLYTGDYFTVSPLTTTTYYATSQAQCEYPQRKAVKVTTTPRPPAPTLGTADTLRVPRFSSVTLSATGVTGAVIHWYRSDTTSTPLYTGNSYAFTPLSAGTMYFYAGAELNGCVSIRKEVVVIVYSGSAPTMTGNSTAITSAHAATIAPAVVRPSIISLKLYPNPTNGEVRFTADKDLSGSIAIVKDVNGREVQREVLQRNGFNISKLAIDGLYFIQVITGKQEVYTGKVLLHK